jgi:hypothetical protein
MFYRVPLVLQGPFRGRTQLCNTLADLITNFPV